MGAPTHTHHTLRGRPPLARIATHGGGSSPPGLGGLSSPAPSISIYIIYNLVMRGGDTGGGWGESPHPHPHHRRREALYIYMPMATHRRPLTAHSVKWLLFPQRGGGGGCDTYQPGCDGVVGRGGGGETHRDKKYPHHLGVGGGFCPPNPPTPGVGEGGSFSHPQSRVVMSGGGGGGCGSHNDTVGGTGRGGGWGWAHPTSWGGGGVGVSGGGGYP